MLRATNIYEPNTFRNDRTGNEQNKRNDYTSIDSMCVCVRMHFNGKLWKDEIAARKEEQNNWWIGELLVCPIGERVCVVRYLDLVSSLTQPNQWFMD